MLKQKLTLTLTKQKVKPTVQMIYSRL